MHLSQFQSYASNIVLDRKMTLNWFVLDVFSVVETEAGEKAAKEEAVVENTTPDYAAGLGSAQVLHYFV